MARTIKSLEQAWNKAVANEKWPEAQRIAEEAFALRPHDHWWCERLSTSLHEQYKYDEALICCEQAEQLKPGCALVQWGKAGIFDNLNRKDEAITIYKRLISAGSQGLDLLEACREGEWQNQTLISDCYFRVAQCFADKNEWASAQENLDIYLTRCAVGFDDKIGYDTSYPLQDVAKLILRIRTAEKEKMSCLVTP